MKRCVVVLFAAAVAARVAAGEPNGMAQELTAAVFKASGGENWVKVKAIDFTFNVAAGTNMLFNAMHHWDVRAGTDTVTWQGKTVTVNVWNPADDADAKAAYARWVNDSYWLLAPLKLKDPGVTVVYKGQQVVDGKRYEILHASFNRVGLTPGDQYNFYVDPETHLVRHWDYMPNPDKKVSGTWDGYKDFGGLKLSTEHSFGDKRIWFTDVVVLTDRE